MMTTSKLVAALFLVSAIWGAYVVIAHWFDVPPTRVSCFHGGYLLNQNHPNFSACIKDLSDLFLTRDYAESKDLAKTFLTLISVTLVTSITFSEKIVDVAKAGALPFFTMIGCWSLLLLSLVACGTGLALITTAAGIAAYAPELDYRQLADRAVVLFLTSGVAFAFALLALIAAGIASLVEKRASGHPSS